MKHLSLTLLLCFISICAFAQQFTVTGRVTDAENNPLIGAEVLVEGTARGVITDVDGKYTIEVTPNQSLKFSYVGFKDQITKIKGGEE